MAIDPYGHCPCGSGKKVKFCCSKDILRDLERVQRLLEGEQTTACLDLLEKLLADGKNRAALLALKASVEIQSEQMDDAERTVVTFLSSHPGNVIALAQSALLTTLKEGGREGVEPLQRALALCGNEMPSQLYEAILLVGRALLAEGHVLAARAHLVLAASITVGDEESDAMAMLSRLHSMDQLPTLLKDEPPLAECPPGAPWQTDFDETRALTRRGAWQEALDKLVALNRNAPRQPAILRNIAILHGRLARVEEFVGALRDYIKLDDVPLDDAVEAEALAQLFDSATEIKSLDILRITYAVTDANALTDGLAGQQRCLKLGIDTTNWDPGDGPPPKSVFWILDRPRLDATEGLTVEDLPLVMGEVHVFGRETDRPSRAELNVSATDDLPAKKQALQEVAGSLLGDQQSSESVDRISRVHELLRPHRQTPPGLSGDDRDSLGIAMRREAMLQRWPNIPMDFLGGKTPAQAAPDPGLRVRLLAAILRHELGSQEIRFHFDCNELRAQLDLPTSTPIDPGDVDVSTCPLARLARLDLEKLSDEQIIFAFFRAITTVTAEAVRRIGPAVLERESLRGKIDRVKHLRFLAEFANTTSETVRWLTRARSETVDSGQSPASVMIAELAVRMERGDVNECERLLEELQARHIKEPGVAQSLYQLLSNAGMVEPDSGSADMPLDVESTTVGDAEADRPGKIWTPHHAEKSGGDKPDLWVPD